MQRVKVDGTLRRHLVQRLSVLPHDCLTDALLQPDGRPPHQRESAQVDETTVCQNVCLLRHLKVELRGEGEEGRMRGMGRGKES